MENKINILVCEHLKDEINAIIGSEKIHDVNILTYPAQCCCPVNTWNKISQLSSEGADDNKIFLLGCSSLIQSKSAQLISDNFCTHKIDKCYYLLADRGLIDDFIKEGAYIITPGWIKDWKRIIKCWGFNKPTATKFFDESCSKLLFLDTGVDSTSIEYLKEFSDYTGKNFEIKHTGLSHIKLHIINIILEWRLENEKRLAQKNISRQKSDNYMILDLLCKQSEVQTEEEAINRLFDLYSMMFAPKSIYYLSLKNSYPSKLWSNKSLEPAQDLEIKKRLKQYIRRDEHTELDSGFVLKISYNNKLLGILEVKQLTFPQYRSDYLILAHTISNVCGLSIENARRYEEINKTQAMLKKTNRKLNYLNTIDELTKTANRRKYDEYISIELKRAVRNQTSLSLILCDIDYFKNYNDTYGHRMGDKCLQTVANILKQTLKRPSDLASRYGGEEFMIIMPNTNANGAKKVADSIKEKVEQLKIEHKTSKTAPNLTVSIGVMSIIPKAGQTPENLFDIVDIALYQAKNNGRNRVEVYISKPSI